MSVVCRCNALSPYVHHNRSGGAVVRRAVGPDAPHVVDSLDRGAQRIGVLHQVACAHEALANFADVNRVGNEADVIGVIFQRHRAREGRAPVVSKERERCGEHLS